MNHAKKLTSECKPDQKLVVMIKGDYAIYEGNDGSYKGCMHCTKDWKTVDESN